MGLSGLADNRGNTFVLAELLSTKYPFAMVLQPWVFLGEKKIWLELDGVPREVYSSAVALSNDVYRWFNPALHIPLRFEDLRLEVGIQLAAPYRYLMRVREKMKL